MLMTQLHSSDQPVVYRCPIGVITFTVCLSDRILRTPISAFCKDRVLFQNMVPAINEIDFLHDLTVHLHLITRVMSKIQGMDLEITTATALRGHSRGHSRGYSSPEKITALPSNRTVNTSIDLIITSIELINTSIELINTSIELINTLLNSLTPLLNSCSPCILFHACTLANT